MDKVTGKLALRILRDLKKREAEFQADREEWYRSGDGRPPKWRVDPETGRSHNYGGRGYSYPYCRHGSSQWTDYDNICGPCEDGYSLYQLALWEAQSRAARTEKRITWLLSAPPEFRRDHDETFGELLDWAMEPVR